MAFSAYAVVARHGVGFEFFGALDDDLRHFGDFTHEAVSRCNSPPLHLRGLFSQLPVSSGEVNSSRSKPRSSVRTVFYCRRVNFASFAHEVFLGQQPSMIAARVAGVPALCRSWLFSSESSSSLRASIAEQGRLGVAAPAVGFCRLSARLFRSKRFSSLATATSMSSLC